LFDIPRRPQQQRDHLATTYTEGIARRTPPPFFVFLFFFERIEKLLALPVQVMMQDGNEGGGGGTPGTGNMNPLYGEDANSNPFGGEDTGSINPFGEPPPLPPQHPQWSVLSSGATAASAPPPVHAQQAPQQAVGVAHPPAVAAHVPAPPAVLTASDDHGSAPLYSPGGVRSDGVEIDISIDAHNSTSNGGSVDVNGINDAGGMKSRLGGGGGGGGGGLVEEIISSTKTVLLTSWLNCLLLFIPVCFIARLAGAGDGPVFALAVLSIIPLAERLGFATEVGLCTSSMQLTYSA
jgi:hypothetical protein